MRRPIEEIEGATGVDVTTDPPREYVDRVLERTAVPLSDSEAERVRSIVESHRDGPGALDEPEQRALDALLGRLRGRDSRERSPPDAPDVAPGRSPASGPGPRHRDPTATSNGGRNA